MVARDEDMSDVPLEAVRQIPKLKLVNLDRG